MATSDPSERVYLSLPARLLILVGYLAAVYGINYYVTGSLTPSGGGEGLWLVSAVGLLAFRLFSAPFFVHPKDSLITAMTALFIVWSVDMNSALTPPGSFDELRIGSLVFLAVVSLAGGLAILLKDVDALEHPVVDSIREVAYSLNVSLGKGEIVFTIPALLGIFAFQPSGLEAQGILLATWVVLTTLQPLEEGWKLVLRIRSRVTSAGTERQIGRIQRVDSPNLLRVDLKDGDAWTSDAVHVARLAHGQRVCVIPLFMQVQEEKLLGTGVCVPSSESETGYRVEKGSVLTWRDAPSRAEIVDELTSFQGQAELAGVVIEGSRISSVRFEVAEDRELVEGQVVFCRQRNRNVFYQVRGAETREEPFGRNPFGTQVAVAAQLGIASREEGFEWYPWVPEMNTPVFVPMEEDWGTEYLETEPKGTELVLGRVPGTSVQIRADFDDLLEFHTAILGITGMGKTELVFDIVRHGVRQGAKIFCVDFTGEYEPRLADVGPETLGFSDSQVEELKEKIETVETAAYGGKKEKGELWDYLRQLRPDVRSQVDQFLAADGGALGIFELADIANTRATLRATEMYISEIFRWARRNRRARRILLVLEEAHTVIPEWNIYGRDSSETASVVGRMTQIALQGRKYGVGLLLVSQRTALVSKTVLSQCNTYLSFALVDQTSLGYLENVFGKEHLSVVPELSPRQVLAYGTGISSNKPVKFEIPFDEAKRTASEALTVRSEDGGEEGEDATAGKDQDPGE